MPSIVRVAEGSTIAPFIFTHHKFRNITGAVEKESDTLIAIAQSQIGVKEAKGNNDGIEVEAYLAVAGLKKGEPWCAAFLNWVIKQAKYPQPRTGWSPALFPEDRRIKTPSPGQVSTSTSQL